MNKSKPKSVAEYIKQHPKEIQKRLKEMRTCVKKHAPKSIENLKWGMPALSYNRILLIYGAFKKHLGFYPTASATQAFKTQLTKYKYAKGSIQFPYSQPLPTKLIAQIVKFRVKEALASDKKWKIKSKTKKS